MIEKTTSQHLLASSLLQLAQKKSLGKISVKLITQNCQLSRETFYYYFEDKNALILWIYKTHTAVFLEKGILTEPIDKVWGQALATLMQHRYFYFEVFADPDLLREILNFFMQDLTSCVCFRTGNKQVTDPDMLFAIRFYASGLLQMTMEWIRRPKPEDAAIISRRMCAIMPQILLQYYIF
jgi:AcrR family transcriptional regulator